MRRYLTIATVVATALIAILPAASADAASGHVLTTGRAAGPAVKPGAVLKASLAKGSSAVFTTSLGKLTCTKSAVTAKVTSNPARPGIAKESLTAQTFGKCTISVSGVAVGGVTVGNLPYNVTVSDAKGHPVKVSERSKAKPLLTGFTVSVGTLSVSCSFKTTAISGSMSNKGNVTVFVKQTFKLAAGGSFCPTSGIFSAAYGPLRDASVKGSPAVFVN
jgi:hypothetical protein